MNERIDIAWYFDFVSPFAYLQLEQFDRLPAAANITLKPVVLGALLSHWQTRGPAEIPGKRVWTYRYAHFRAQQLGIPFRMPPAHPFNPIRLLRLALLMNCERSVVRDIFRFIWREGQSADSPAGWQALCQRLNVDPAEDQLNHPELKLALRRSTDDALAAGAFGVPTAVWRNELFWGEDATALLLNCLNDPSWLSSAEVRRISDLPVGVTRTA